jgi:YesN/AraC family two-component response regulator
MKCRALFMMILHRLSEILLYNVDAMPMDYRISRITRYIAMHYSEKLMVKQLAEMLRLDTGYFGILFKQETGLTMHQYLNRVRVNNAENMLQTGGFRVHEVAEQCGFSDVFYFYKQFRALRGYPPSRCIPKAGGLPDED